MTGSAKRSDPDEQPTQAGAEGLSVDAGRPFQPRGERPAPAPPAGASAETELPPVAEPLVPEFLGEDQVRRILTAKGSILHALLAVDKSDESEEWIYTEHDLEAIAPPLTSILNRYPMAATVVGKFGDMGAVGAGMFAYATRSMEERAQALARLQTADLEEEDPTPGFRFGGPQA